MNTSIFPFLFLPYIYAVFSADAEQSEKYKFRLPGPIRPHECFNKKNYNYFKSIFTKKILNKQNWQMIPVAHQQSN